MLHLLKIGHIFGALFNLAFIYTPVHNWPHGFTVVQFISTPLLVITGIGLVKIRKKQAAAI